MTAYTHEGRTYWFGRDNDAPRDPGNRAFPAARSTGPRRAVRWHRAGPPLTQRVGSCTGNALAGWFNSRPSRPAAAPVLNEEDAERFYSWATHCDRIRGVWPPDDTGSTGPAVCKGARRNGFLTGWTHAFGVDHLLDALQLGPVMVGTVWLSGMFTPDSRGVVVPAGDVVGGHEYLADEYVPDAGLIGFQQSWGPGWGVDGRWYMRVADVAALLADGGDVTVPVVVSK